MAAFAPMPSASESTATVVTNGVLKSVRKASLRLAMMSWNETMAWTNGRRRTFARLAQPIAERSWQAVGRGLAARSGRLGESLDAEDARGTATRRVAERPLARPLGPYSRNRTVLK